MNRTVCFAENEEPGSTEHWKQQSSILNGKVILKRLGLLGEKGKRRYDLASRIADRNRIDPEIREYIAEFKKM
ncbi:MAG: hypothetical protein D3924_00525 [Candidatus Electrothrix sp. AR4]|nr:hypothetical protein [Candidatus Electrothrix sp. AR4]